MSDESLEVRDMRNGEWYWIHRAVYENYTKKIGLVGLALYNAYSSYARNTGSAFPSRERIAKELGISIPTVWKYDKILEQNKLIRIESGLGKGRGQTNTVFLLKINGIKEINTKENGIKEINTNPLLVLNSHSDGIKQFNTNYNNKENVIIKNIYDAYKLKINKESILTVKATEKIKTRLKFYSEEYLLKAIDRFSKNGWRMQNNSDKGIAWFFETDEKIATFLILKEQKVAGVTTI